MTRLFMILALFSLSFSATANTKEVTTFVEFSQYIEPDRDYYGTVMVAANQPDVTFRMVCMVLRFKKDEANQRYDYLYKGWHQGDPDSPCEFDPTKSALITQKVQCVSESPEMRNMKTIDFSQTFYSSTDLTNSVAGFRSLSFSANDQVENGSLFNHRSPGQNRGAMGARAAFDPNRDVHALSRCLGKDSTIDAVFSANVNGITVADKAVPGLLDQSVQKVMTIQLDLSFINGSSPLFEAVDYNIIIPQQ